MILWAVHIILQKINDTLSHSNFIWFDMCPLTSFKQLEHQNFVKICYQLLIPLCLMTSQMNWVKAVMQQNSQKSGDEIWNWAVQKKTEQTVM